MSGAIRSTVLSSYRQLLRAQRGLFDLASKVKARKYTRAQYEKNRLADEPGQLEKLVRTAQEAKVYIETNLVQGVKAGDGPVKVKIGEKTHKTTELHPSFEF